MIGRSTARAAQDVGAAALLGGNLFGRIAMHPALRDVSSEAERGRVLNNAWRRYGTVNSLSLAAVIGGWAAARRDGERDALLTPAERTLARAQDATVVAVALTGVATALGGMRLNRSAPDGAVPLADGTEPAADTPAPAARTKRAINLLSALNAAAEVTLVALNAALAQQARGRPPARRLLRRAALR